jgi:hypothetical protein
LAGQGQGGWVQSHCFPRPGVGATNLLCICTREGQIAGGPHGPLGRDFLWHVGVDNGCAGKHITLVGDCGNEHYPVSFTPPKKNAWVWTKAKYLCNNARFGTFYDDEDNKDKLLLTGASEAELTENPLPRLALPTFVVEFLRKQGGGMSATQTAKICVRPHQGGGIEGPPDKWQLVLDWCLAVEQGGDNGTSILNLGSPEPALCQDLDFLKWCELHLKTTLGQGPQQEMGQYNGGGPGSLQLVKQIT